MHPKLEDPGPDLRPEAVDVLTEWLGKRGFKLNEATPGGQYRYSEGYFTRGVGNSARWRDYDAHTHGGIAYRGGNHNYVRAKLRAVAEVLERLGVEYDVEENEYHYPWLIVTISHALDGELDDATPAKAKPVKATSAD